MYLVGLLAAASAYVLCFAELESKLLFTVHRIIVLGMQKRIETIRELFWRALLELLLFAAEYSRCGSGRRELFCEWGRVSLRGSFLFLPHSNYSNNKTRCRVVSHSHRSTNLELVWPRLNHNYYPPPPSDSSQSAIRERVLCYSLYSLFVCSSSFFLLFCTALLFLTQSTGIRVPTLRNEYLDWLVGWPLMPWSESVHDRSEFTWQPTTTKWDFTLSPKANEFAHLAVDCKFQISWPIRLMQWLGEVLCCLVHTEFIDEEQCRAGNKRLRPVRQTTNWANFLWSPGLFSPLLLLLNPVVTEPICWRLYRNCWWVQLNRKGRLVSRNGLMV